MKNKFFFSVIFKKIKFYCGIFLEKEEKKIQK